MNKLPPHIANPNPKIYLSDNYGVTDVETTNKEKGSPLNRDNHLLGGASRRVVRTGGDERSSPMLPRNTTKYYWGDEYRSENLIQEVEEGDFWVAHNAKFELQWFRRCGIDLTKQVVWCTMLAEYMIAGNRGWALDLDSTAARWGVGQKESVVSKMIKNGVCPSEIPRPWLEHYCKVDVDITHKVFLKQREWILNNNPELLNVIYTACLFCVVLADIEFNGVCVDEQRVIEEYNIYNKRLFELDTELEKFASINWNSPDQKAEFIYDVLKFKELKKNGEVLRTPKGKRLTKMDFLLQLKATNKKQKRFIEILQERSKVNAALSKTLMFFYGTVKELGGVFYAQFNQAVTRTHRLSSSGRPIKFDMYDKNKSVQFQNFPRVFKRLFKARNDGWDVSEADAPQLEFRIATQEGKDKAAIEDILSGHDVHRFSASELNAVTMEEVTNDQRQAGKADTFKPLYGGTSGTPAQQRYYAAFRKRYPEITDTQQGWINQVLDTKQLKTSTGLVFYWPDTKVTNSGYVVNTSKICNNPIQYLATGEIIPINVVYQWHRMKAEGLESFIVNTIHDSTISEINPIERELYEEIVVKAFTEDVYQYLYNVYDIKVIVPLGAEIKISKFLGEAKGELHTKEPPFKLGDVNE